MPRKRNQKVEIEGYLQVFYEARHDGGEYPSGMIDVDDTNLFTLIEAEFSRLDKLTMREWITYKGTYRVTIERIG